MADALLMQRHDVIVASLAFGSSGLLILFGQGQFGGLRVYISIKIGFLDGLVQFCPLGDRP